MDNYGCTSLHSSSENWHLNIVKYLIKDAKVYINIKNHSGSTLLHLASEKGYLDIVKYLLNKSKY